MSVKLHPTLRRGEYCESVTDVVRKKDYDERVAGIDFPRVYIRKWS